MFDGSNPRIWIKKCMKYFTLCKILDNQKVDLASLYLIGKAESWYNSYIVVRRQVDWEDFVVDLCSRFKEDIGSNVVEEFNKLSQSGTIDEYLDTFENLKGLMPQRNPLLPEEYFLDSFMGGLKPNLKHFVRAFKPATLVDVVEYARLQNATIQATSSTTKYQPKPISNYKPLSLPSTTKPLLPTPSLSTQTQTSHNTRPYRPTRYLTPAERADKQAKGLCYFCDAPYDKGHKCQIQQTQLFAIEIPGLDDEEYGEDGVEETLEMFQKEPYISISALFGNYGYNTMRVTSYVGKKPLHILIDSGSTHNFLDVSLAMKLGCHIVATPVKSVSVADGNTLSCQFTWKGFQWRLENTMFVTDTLHIPLGGCDMVLGVQ